MACEENAQETFDKRARLENQNLLIITPRPAQGSLPQAVPQAGRRHLREVMVDVPGVDAQPSE